MEAPMRKSKAARPPPARRETTGEPTEKGQVGSREYARREAVRKDQRSVDEVMKPGPPPDPGLEEDYGKRSGEIPSEEPGNPKRDEGVGPT
jgi:hypothetical protein